MSALGERAVQAQDGIADLETALERTQRALKTAEKVDLAAGKAKRRSGKFVKLLLIATVVGVVVLVARKALSSGSSTTSNEPYGSPSTDR